MASCLTGRNSFLPKTQIQYHVLPLAGRSFSLKLISMMPWYKKIFVFLLYLLCMRSRGRKLAAAHMGQLGYATMLRIFLQSGKQQLHSFFTLLADPSRYPLLFHCSIGKDRTGLVAALILTLLGVSRNDILDDYHLSEQELSKVKPKIQQALGRMGIQQEEFSQAQRQSLAEALDWVIETHGSVENFLTQWVGLSQDTVDSIRQLLTPP